MKLHVRGAIGKKVALRQGYFTESNTYASKEKMSPDAHERRMAGLRKSWSRIKSKVDGENIGSTRNKRKVKRVKLRITLEKELREIQTIARTHADQAMRRLAEIINADNVPESVQIVAAQVILDRAYGRATNTNVNANIDANGKASDITGKELQQRIDKALRRVEAATSGIPEKGPRKERPLNVCEPDRDTDSSTKH